MIRPFIAALAATVVIASASSAQDAQQAGANAGAVRVAPAAPFDTAVFGGGCFWCMEPPFDRVPGVRSTTSGYTGGTLLDPTYKQVSNGGTGHVEVVRVIYDPARVSYARLLDVFWRNVDPLTANRQFCDGGDQYRSAIFFQNEAQRAAAVASKTAIERSGRFNRPIVTEITKGARFYPAEEYHQDYYKKNPVRYKFYRGKCGRDDRLKDLWGKPVA